MKVAFITSGLPRFRPEFDDQLKNLQNFDQADWFFLLWKGKEDQYIAPSWPINDLEQTKERIQRNLPANHRIAHIELVDPPPYIYNDRPLNLTHWTTAPNIWYMWYGLKTVNQMRLDYEKMAGEYDLVIRTRPDISINEPVNLQLAKEWLDQNPMSLLTPADGRTCLVGQPVNDQFAIGLSPTITKYCECFDNLFNYNDQGLPYHAESLLAYHFMQTGISTPMTNFTQSIRIHKNEDGTWNWGRWI